MCIIFVYFAAGVGVHDRPEAVLEALSWSCDQQFVQLSSVSSHLQDAGQSGTSPQVGDITHDVIVQLLV